MIVCDFVLTGRHSDYRRQLFVVLIDNELVGRHGLSVEKDLHTVDNGKYFYGSVLRSERGVQNLDLSTLEGDAVLECFIVPGGRYFDIVFLAARKLLFELPFDRAAGGLAVDLYLSVIG